MEHDRIRTGEHRLVNDISMTINPFDTVDTFNNFNNVENFYSVNINDTVHTFDSVDSIKTIDNIKIIKSHHKKSLIAIDSRNKPKSPQH